MPITPISHKIQSTLAHLHGSGSDLATKAHVHELGTELLELAEAVERLSREVDLLVSGRSDAGDSLPES